MAHTYAHVRIAKHDPKGWETVAALPPLPGPVECVVCGRPAVIGTPEGPRCPRCPPGWGERLDWTRKGPDGYACTSTRCYCGRCPHYETQTGTSATALSGTDLKKDRAALGGRRAHEEAVGGGRVPTRPPEALTGRPPAPSGSPTAQAAADRLHGPPAGAIRRAVFEAVAGSPRGATDDEVEVALGRPHQTVSSARNALVAAGYLRDSGRVRPTRSGSPAAVWVVTEAAARWAPVDAPLRLV